MLRRFTSSLSMLALGITLGCGLTEAALAAPPEEAPDSLVQGLRAIEQAADRQDVAAVMGFYAPGFTSADGFDRAQFEATLGQFWQQFATVDYTIELVAWEPNPNGFTAETLTQITGTQTRPERRLTLEAEVRSRQRFENGQVVYQEVLSEKSRLTTGTTPPNLTVLLPERVAPGQSYEFDAIVQEPLRDRSLLGIALDEGVTVEDFLTPRPITLDFLSAGGLFKIGEAPAEPDNRWISAVIVREDGITVETRRLQVAP